MSVIARLAAGVLTLAAAGSTVAATVISVPDDAGAAPGSSITIPISATPADGIVGLDLRLEYDPDVLNATTVSRTTITAGFSLNFNLTPAGRVIISLFHSSPMVGSGPVATITFDVVGTLGSQTSLSLTQAMANEGAIPASVDHGLFRACDASVTPGEISGLSVAGSSPTTLSWLPAAAPGDHDIVSGELADLHADGGVQDGLCLDNDRTGTSFIDPRPSPVPGAGAYYLVRVQNACGSGTYGSASSGTERVPAVDCP